MRRLCVTILATALSVSCGDDEKAQDTSETTAPDTTDAADTTDTTDTADSGGDSAAPDTTDTADTSEPDTTDTADGAAPEPNFACIGTDPAYPTGSGTIEYDIALVDYITLNPIADVHARFCGRLDIFCESPIHEDTSGADGLIHVKVPAGFDGFIFGEGGGIMPSIAVVDPPIVAPPAEQPVQFGLVTPAQWSAIGSIFGAAVDPASGHVAMVAYDCDGKPASGIQFTISSATVITVVGYVDGGVPSPSAIKTDVSGAAGAINLPPGAFEVVASTADGKGFGRARGFVSPGAVTRVNVTPQQRTPDLSCGGVVERWPSFAGDVSVSYHLRDFGSLRPVGGAHLKVCASADPACATPLDEGDSDGFGNVMVSFAFTADGFSGFLEITGAGLFPTRIVYTEPLGVRGATEGTFTIDLLTPEELGVFATAAGTTLDPELAHVAIEAVDCKSRPAHGMSVSADPSTDATKVIYVSSGLPAPAASATDDSGLAGIFNVPAGEEVVLSATLGATPMGSARITPMKGFFHEITIFPTK